MNKFNNILSIHFVTILLKRSEIIDTTFINQYVLF
jgi:hypothetical protein